MSNEMDTKCNDIEPKADGTGQLGNCYVKKQLLVLQERINRANNLKLMNSGNSNNLSTKSILDRAVLLSNNISEAHDERADCKCFQMSTSSIGIEDSDEKRKSVLTNLNKLNDLLGQLDESNVHEKQTLQKTKLNPFSKCFVPKDLHITNSESFPQISNASKLSNLNSTSRIGQKCKFHNENGIKLSGKIKHKNEAKLTWDVQKQKQSSARIPFNNNSIRSLFEPAPKESRQSNKFSSVWSVCPEDIKLLAPGNETKQCGCPPSFGFNIPPDFFGNPFNLKSLCSEHGIHASFFPQESEKFQEEYIPQIDFEPKILPDSIESNSLGPEELREFRLINYKMTFEKFVAEICSITEKVEKSIESDEGISSDEDKRDDGKECSSPNFLGDKNMKLFSNPRDVCLNDFDENDLLNNFSRCIRLCQWYFSHPSSSRPLCNSPCSVWCDSTKNDKLWGWNKTNVEAKMQQKTQCPNDNSKHCHDSNTNVTSHYQNGVSRESLQANEVESLNKIRHLKDFKSESHSKPNSTRSRHSSGDSGYDGSSTCPKEIAPISNNQHLNDWLDFDSTYWIPLPDCVPQQSHDGTSVRKNQPTVNNCNRRPLKVQKHRSKNQTFNESTEPRSKSNITRMKNFSKLGQHAVFEDHWRLMETDFPKLK